jgi:intein/homing endonuclease
MPSIVVGRDEEDLKKYGEECTLFVGKHLVGTGDDAHLTTPVLLDALRPHVICLTGKRGSGKCLTGDSLITLGDGSLVPIKDLESESQDVLALNDELKVKHTQRENFYKRKTCEILHVKLRSGREIKLTPEHPLLTIKGWRPAQDLHIGSRIAAPRTIPVFGKKEMPEHEINILAYLIAEGHTKKQVLFANSDNKIVSDFKDSLKKFDPSLELIKEKKNHYRISSPEWKNKILMHDKRRTEKGQFMKGSKNIYEKRSIRKFIEKHGLFGLKSTEKTLSNDIIKLKKENLALFLNKLFSCDGSIYKENDYWESCYASSSEKMIKQIQHLLLRFSILSKLRGKTIKLNGKTFHSFELVINSVNTLKFIEEIGFFGEKEKRQKTAKKEILSKARNPNIDTIPKEIWDSYKPKNWADIGRYVGYKYPKAMRERIRYSPSRQTLLHIAKAEKNENLRLLAESDVFWDEIVAFELIEGEFDVYDISVPDFHNFIANDIIVHNSFSIGVIVEEMMKLPEHVKTNLCALVIDTQGIFWTMKTPNEKNLVLLNEWSMKPQGFGVDVYIPAGQERIFSEAGVDYDGMFSIMPSELSAEDWLDVFEIKQNDPIGILLQQSVSRLSGTYNINNIIDSIMQQDGFETEKLALRNYFETSKNWGIFGQSKMPQILEGGKFTVLDVSLTPTNVRSLLVALVSRKILEERVTERRKEELAETEGRFEKRKPLCWILIDEAHNFLPSEGRTASTEILNTIVKEGRQPGITLVLATQRPEKLHADSLAQCDLIISHRLTAKNDIESLKAIMQTYLLFDISKYINELPKIKGTAIILDDNSERLYKLRIRPRQSWHAGSSPTAV